MAKLGQGLRSLRHWSRPGSLLFLVLLAVLFAALAYNRTVRTIRHNNLEWQGLDIVSHAIMVHWEANGLPPSLLGYDEAYPRLAHALAATLTPLFHGNAIQAMRCTALIALFLLFSTQYTLLARFLRPAPALAALVLWQVLCAQTHCADTNHFLLGNFFFGQAVGTVGFWSAVVFITAPAPGRAGRWLVSGLAFLAAWFAYQCHLVPGVLAFGTVAALLGLRFLQNGDREDGLRGLLAVAGAAAVILSSSQWQLMASARKTFNESWLPVANLWLLLLWFPTLVAALTRFVRHTRWAGSRPPLEDLELVLTAGLLVAGGLQAYFAYEWWVLGTTSAYTVKKLFFFSFPLAALLWFYWLARALAPASLLARLPIFLRAVRPGATWAAALPAAYFSLTTLLYREANRPTPDKDRDPLQVSRRLAGQREQFPRSFYFDPEMPMGSLFASVTGAQLNRDLALRAWESLSFKKAPVPIWTLVRDGHVAYVCVPRNVDPRAVFGVPVPVVNDGVFRRCDLRQVTPPYAPEPSPAERVH